MSIVSPWPTTGNDLRSDDFKLSPDTTLDDKYIHELRPSQFTERLIYVDGKPFNHKGGFMTRKYLRPIYNRKIKRLLLKCGRQTEKSSTLGNRLLTIHCLTPFFRSLFVTPREEQARRFSMDRIERPLSTSPGLQIFHRNMISNNILLKEFPNHSTLTMLSAYHSADRIRGIPADKVEIDEIQDIVSDHIPIIEEVLSHSDPENRYFWASGTPKTMDNPIEVYWDQFSTQHEWTVPCERHSPIHWNVLGIKSIGTKGVICDHCGGAIDVQQGKWQITGDPDARWQGYRISQLMVPWMPWDEVLDRLHRYPTNIFYNEVLGLSYDSGTRPLSLTDLKRNSSSHIKMTMEDVMALKKKYPSIELFMGVDWGTGQESFTVAVILAYHPMARKLSFVYAKKFIGEEADPVIQLEIIKQMAEDLGVKNLGCDWGFGHYQNDALMRHFRRPRMATYMYSGSHQGKKLRYDEGLRKFMVNRTAVMSDIFNAIKRGVFAFPSEQSEFIKRFAPDFLAIFAEYSERSRTILYNHPTGRPDDTFHAFTYAVLASMLTHPRPDILIPDLPED